MRSSAFSATQSTIAVHLPIPPFAANLVHRARSAASITVRVDERDCRASLEVSERGSAVSGFERPQPSSTKLTITKDTQVWPNLSSTMSNRFLTQKRPQKCYIRSLMNASINITLYFFQHSIHAHVAPMELALNCRLTEARPFATIRHVFEHDSEGILSARTVCHKPPLRHRPQSSSLEFIPVEPPELPPSWSLDNLESLDALCELRRCRYHCIRNR